MKICFFLNIFYKQKKSEHTDRLILRHKGGFGVQICIFLHYSEVTWNVVDAEVFVWVVG